MSSKVKQIWDQANTEAQKLQSSTLSRLKNQLADDKTHFQQHIETLRNTLEYERNHQLKATFVLRWSTLVKIRRLERLYETQGPSEQSLLYKEKVRCELETNI